MLVTCFGEVGGSAVGRGVPESMRLPDVRQEEAMPLYYVHLVERGWVGRT